VSRSKFFTMTFLLGFLILAAVSIAYAHAPELEIDDVDGIFANIIETRDLTFTLYLICILIAGVVGAGHALSPGHGKAVVAAYLIGTRSKVRHACYLGFIVTLTHTFGVFALGLATYFASRYILPEQLYPWLSLASGVMVFIIGVVMLVMRIYSAFSAAASNHSFAVSHSHYGHKAHDVNNHHHFDESHDDSSPDRHYHDHDNDTHFQHDWKKHHDHKHKHSHIPPGFDGSPVTWRSLLSLGVSGGILPCPSALVLMLSAISLNRVGFGLVLVLAFSAGLAAMLTLVGILFVKARKILEWLPFSNPLMMFLPIAASLVIMVLGIGIVINSIKLIL
jgi:nickel/cobalt exporter